MRFPNLPMSTVLRVLPLVLGSCCTAVGAGAQSAAAAEERPPIFSDSTLPMHRDSPSLPPLATSEPVASPVSSRLRSAIVERIASAAGGFDAASPSPTPTTRHWKPDVLMMERYFVTAPAPRRIVFSPHESPLIRLLRTGTLYHRVGPRITTRVNLRVLPILQRNAGGPIEFTRFEISARFSW